MAGADLTPPTDRELLRLLESLRLGSRIRLSDRGLHPYQSSAPAEVLALEVDGRPLELLCKYAGGLRRETGDHRRGVAYEGRVYAELVARARTRSVGYYGAPRSPCGEVVLLLLEFAADAARLTQTTRVGALVDAASWLGCFHAEFEEEIGARPPDWLARHDREHYLRRTARARRVAGRLGCSVAGLEDAIAVFESSLDCLLGECWTVVHGEYYPKNILVRDASILPVDWESAAAGPGEIDLATLTVGWGDELESACGAAYVASRWPAGAPPGFSRRLALSRMYVQLCWLEGHQQVDELCRLAGRLAV